MDSDRDLYRVLRGVEQSPVGGRLRWNDPRHPGSTDVHHDPSLVMRHWSKEKMHEFTDYVEAQLAATPDAGSPWHAEWVMETIPTWKSDEKKILDCRLELMRRRAHIEVAGPKSIDDWILKWEMDRGIGPRGLDQSIQDLFHGNQRAPPPEIRRYVRRTRPGGPAKRPAPP